ncbi:MULTISPECIES: hypothetical protein [Streptomyces]|uniref:Uncharacterized protein n=1 Tax=Streptomyces fimbriatus TaxID=68197 RepID=A0ABW0DKG2_STRFI
MPARSAGAPGILVSDAQAAAEARDPTGGIGARAVSDCVGAEPAARTAGAVVVHTERYSLDEAPLAYERPHAGEVRGRAVVPHG